MEENFRRETSKLPAAANMGCNRDLTRSNSGASSLTAENCKNVFHRSENGTPNIHAEWTDEKHNLFIHQLEVSFVKQLHRSKVLLAESPEQNQRDISERLLINVNCASEQFNISGSDCRQNINWVRAGSLSSSNSADSCAPRKGKFNSTCMHCPPPAEMPDLLKLCSTTKQGKGIMSHGLATCSQKFASNCSCNENLSDLRREGMGQNFLDADNRSTSNFESKTALTDSSSLDQFVLSGEHSAAEFFSEQ